MTNRLNTKLDPQDPSHPDNKLLTEKWANQFGQVLAKSLVGMMPSAAKFADPPAPDISRALPLAEQQKRFRLVDTDWSSKDGSRLVRILNATQDFLLVSGAPNDTCALRFYCQEFALEDDPRTDGGKRHRSVKEYFLDSSEFLASHVRLPMDAVSWFALEPEDRTWILEQEFPAKAAELAKTTA